MPDGRWESLHGSHWRRRDDGWIGVADGTARRRLSSTGERQDFVHLAGIHDGGTPETELVLERRLLELFDRVRETMCRRCRSMAWRFAGKGERYVRHGCASKQRERKVERICVEERRAAGPRLYALLNHFISEYADPIAIFKQSARSAIEMIDANVKARSARLYLPTRS